MYDMTQIKRTVVFSVTYIGGSLVSPTCPRISKDNKHGNAVNRNKQKSLYCTKHTASQKRLILVIGTRRSGSHFSNPIVLSK